jgi:hypothetical protein
LPRQARDDLLVDVGNLGPERSGALLIGAHLRFGFFESRIAGAAHRKLLGRDALLGERVVRETQPRHELLALSQFQFQRTLEPLHRAELTLEKCHQQPL